ncbi:MAG: DNA-binding XRE family transcriptional regulator [Hyphomicrobiaceae bacterium]|jgi:DNA-binding XRE family transcriptional regulator
MIRQRCDVNGAQANSTNESVRRGLQPDMGTGQHGAVDMPLLCLSTQAKTKKGAYLMAKDAIESAINKPELRVRVHPGSSDTFSIEANDESLLIAFALKQLRATSGKSVREVARRLGSASPTAYSQYENGQRKPSIEKFSRLLRAIDDDLIPVITLP